VPDSWNHFFSQPGGSVVTVLGIMLSTAIGLWIAWVVAERLDRALRTRPPWYSHRTLSVALGMLFAAGGGAAFIFAVAEMTHGPVNGMEIVGGDDGPQLVVHFAHRDAELFGLANGRVASFRVEDGAQVGRLDLTRWGDDLSLVRIRNNLFLGRRGGVYFLYDYSTLAEVGTLSRLLSPHLPDPLAFVERFTPNAIKVVTQRGRARWVRFDQMLDDGVDFSRPVSGFTAATCHLTRAPGVVLMGGGTKGKVVGLTGARRQPCSLPTDRGELTLGFLQEHADEGGQRIMYGLLDQKVQWKRNIDDWVANNESFELLAPEVSADGLRFYWLRAGLSLSRFNLDPMSGTLNDVVTYF
jgi:hypothetical protein